MRQRIYELYEDWCEPEPRELILLKSYNVVISCYSPSLTNVHYQWRNLLSSCRSIREDIILVLWRGHPVILQPLVARCVNFALEWPVRKLVTEVRPKDNAPNCCAISWKDLEILVLLGSRHPTLDQIDVAMDLSILNAMVLTHTVKCADHAERFSKSPALRQLVRDIPEHKDSGGFLHFRIHSSDQTAKRTRRSIAENYTSYASAKNYASDACNDHEIGLCQRLTCRLLHGIEEMYGDTVDSSMLGVYLIFFGYDREDGRNYVYEACDDMMPIMLQAPPVYNTAGQTYVTQNVDSAKLFMAYDWPVSE